MQMFFRRFIIRSVLRQFLFFFYAQNSSRLLYIMIFSSYKSCCYKRFVKITTMQIVSACCALNCLFLQPLLVLERAKWTLPRHTSAAAAAKLAGHWCVQISRLFHFQLVFERFKISELRARAAEIDLLRSRIAELENTKDADDEPMHIDADNDHVVILEASLPVSAASNVAAVSNIATAKKVSIDCLNSFSV